LTRVQARRTVTATRSTAEGLVRHIVLSVALFGSLSCATAGSHPGPGVAAPSDRVVLVDDAGQTYRTSVAPNAKASIAAPATRAFDATRAAFEALGIPVASADPAAGQVTSGNFWKMRSLGKTPLSVYLECGRTATGAISEMYRVYLTVTSVVRPDGQASSQLETSVTAYARNIEGTSSAQVACGTTGRLEEQLRQDVTRRVTAAPR
jgi:hypothetical protein